MRTKGHSEKYNNASFSYYYDSHQTPKYLSLSFKLTNANGDGGRACLLDNSDTSIYKFQTESADLYSYQIYRRLPNGGEEVYLVTNENTKFKLPEILFGEVKAQKITYTYKISFWTKSDEVKKVMDWIWDNKLIPRR